MPLKVEEARGILEIVYGPSHDSAGRRFGVRHQVCHFDERYYTLRCAVDIDGMQPVMIVPGCAIRKKESFLVELVACLERCLPAPFVQVFDQMVERDEH